MARLTELVVRCTLGGHALTLARVPAGLVLDAVGCVVTFRGIAVVGEEV
jgi:hypothetical protein